MLTKYEHPGYPLVVIGVDPGGTTGVAVFGLTEKTVEYIEHFQWGDQNYVWQQIHELVHKWQKKGFTVVLVVEQFDKRPGIINPDFSAKYITRDISNYIKDVEIVWQLPAQAKTLVPQPKGGRPDALKRFGWYSTSNRHANDAVRHFIVYAAEKLRHLPTVLIGWPKQKRNT